MIKEINVKLSSAVCDCAKSDIHLNIDVEYGSPQGAVVRGLVVKCETCGAEVRRPTSSNIPFVITIVNES